MMKYQVQPMEARLTIQTEAIMENNDAFSLAIGDMIRIMLKE